MKNPDWKREELILALDLYFKLDYGQMHGKHPEIIRLSETLKRLNLHSSIPNSRTFRSVNSVALKLANFKKLDQNFSGRGMRDGSKEDVAIWKEFHRHRDTLRKEAEIIMHVFSGNDASAETLAKSALARVIYDFHKSKESDPVIKKMIFAKSGLDAATCEICQFSFFKTYGQLGAELVEIHYHKILSDLPTNALANLADFSIVCCNCHKVLDRYYGIIDKADIATIIKKK